MITEHPPKLGPQTQTIGVEPILWMHVSFGSAETDVVLYPIESKTGPAIYEPMFGEAMD